MMPISTTAEAARANRRRGTAADGVSFWHTLYIGTSRYNMAPGAPDPEPGTLFPMAFLVEQDPGSTASAHYHQADQFQVVVAGGGTLGLHEVAPLTVHFTGAYTAYGPIRAGEQGVSYFTLRNGFDPGARFMNRPENRAALRNLPDRQHRESVTGPLPVSQASTSFDPSGSWVSSASIAPAWPGSLESPAAGTHRPPESSTAGIDRPPGFSASSTHTPPGSLPASSSLPSASPEPQTLLGPASDGMAAWRYLLPPHARLEGPDPTAGHGQYWLVIAGALEREGELLTGRSCSFVSPQEAAFTGQAGPEGLDVLAMQFPRRMQS